MTRDCGQHRDDQRLRTVQMTADLWGGGERVPEFDRYPLFRSCSLILPVPRSSRALSSRLLSAVICTVRSLWSSLCCPQSLVIP
ncbi:unnamed protein product, partial [Staurois parvus]